MIDCKQAKKRGKSKRGGLKQTDGARIWQSFQRAKPIGIWFAGSIYQHLSVSEKTLATSPFFDTSGEGRGWSEGDRRGKEGERGAEDEGGGKDEESEKLSFYEKGGTGSMKENSQCKRIIQDYYHSIDASPIC